MKRTFTATTRTLIRGIELKDMTFQLDLYEGCKYTAKCEEDLGKEIIVEYTGVTSWDIIEGGFEAEEIERETDASRVDEFHEYLVLHFEDGTESTFRNSHVTMFIL